MGIRLNRLDEPVFTAGPKHLLTEFGIHHRLESCEILSKERQTELKVALVARPGLLSGAPGLSGRLCP